MGAFNTIYGRIGNNDSIDIVISLLSSVCVPTLMYATELIGDNVAVVDKLSKSYDRSIMKIFSTFEKNTVRLCQYYTGLLPINYQIDLQRVMFLRRIKNYPDRQLFQLLSRFDSSDTLELRYLIEPNDAPKTIKQTI